MASTVLAQVGPLRVTGEGVSVAVEVVVRVLVMAGAVTLYYLTTRPAELVASLQAHGVPARTTFVIHNAVAMIPRLAERAGEVTDAQRARGLDSEGSLRRRLRGVTAVAGPTVSGAIARGRDRDAGPGDARLHATRPPHAAVGAGRQRQPAPARWGMVAAAALLVVLRLAGWTAPW